MRSACFLCRKVTLGVSSAAWVEASLAVGTHGAAVHIFSNRQFVPADSAENCPHVPLSGRPHADCMSRKKLMAILAGIVDAAVCHFDRDNIERRMVVGAPGLFCLPSILYLRSYGPHVNTRTQRYNSPRYY